MWRLVGEDSASSIKAEILTSTELQMNKNKTFAQVRS